MEPALMTRPVTATRGRPRRRGGWIAGVAGLIVLAGAVWLLAEECGWTWGGVSEAIERLPKGAVAAAMVLLPLAGFSIGVMYVAVGAVFGPWQAGLVVAGATVVHLVVTDLVTRRWGRAKLARWLERHGRSVPEVPDGEERAVALGLAVVPGVPYVMRNALLGLSAVPLRTYLPICLPIYVARSYLALAIGDLGHGITAERVWLLIGVGAAKGAVCLAVWWRLKRRRRRTARGRSEKSA